MLSPPLPPIKTLTPVPDDNDGDEIIKYEYFIRFNPTAYYKPYREVLKLLMPYWCNKSEYSPEEVSDLLKQVYNHLAPGITQLENENLIDSHIGAAIRHWVTIIHDALPCQLCLADWHTTIARSAPEFLPRLSPNVPLPGEEGFDMDKPPIVLESYLLQHTIFAGTRLRLGALANNTDFPEEAEEVIVFSDPPAKKEPPVTPTCSIASSSTSAPLIPPRSTCPQRMPISLILPVVNSSGVSPSPHNHSHMHALATVLSQPNSPPSLLANCHAPPLWSLFSPVQPLAPVTPDQMICHGFREMAGAFQDLCQALLSPGASTLAPISGAASTTMPNITTIAPSPLPPGNTAPLVDKVDLVKSSLCSTRRRLKHDSNCRNVPPLPPITGQVVMSLAPDEPSPPASEPSKAPSPKRGGQSKPKGAKSKAKGKGKAVVPVPEPARSPMPLPAPQTSTAHEEPPFPKKNLKRKHPTAAVDTSEPGPSTQVTGSRPTHAHSATAKAARIPEVQTDMESARSGPSIKKPRFSPEKVAKHKSSQPVTAAAPDPTPQDSNRMFHGRPKQQFFTAELTQAQDPEVTGIPINRHNSRPELENYHFKDLITAPDEFFDPVRYGHKNGTYGACSSRYAFYVHAPDHYKKASIATSCSSTVSTVSWSTLTTSIVVEFVLATMLFVISQETLDQFASAEGGNELIEALSGAYREVRSFIVDDGLRCSVGQPLNLPQGPEYVPSDNDTSMWNESEDNAGEEDNEQAAGPSGTQRW
ncbi:hypothetical protein EV421DRAFT_1739255 [Armillaria borealis]|uniref:Uncharacterized protein n=1 Tax=Armillaria borealis TaxID=47425 RepID=A0AA39J7V1_9AGAR|nr:hypothetical protein EV421DRAFT_1739255 [Armillaria borealis]